METDRSHKKFIVYIYEFLGTAIIMYSLMMSFGNYVLTCSVTLILMLIAWDVSGAHFNPAITLGVFVS